ncbi:MAG: hypothetical protein LBC53_04905 [Spirochaetaceae bacterium]|nr:hypothetical protein [Spirochaetaceae bacterium]
MKNSNKLILFAAGLILGLGGAQSALAQDVQDDGAWRDKLKQPANQSEFYVKQTNLDKVYQTSKGYILQYRTGLMQDKKVNIAIPYDWFDAAKTDVAENGKKNVAKCDLIWMDSGRQWPHISVYYKGGEIDHIRLYVSKWRDHQTWGFASESPTVEKLFNEAEAWKL